MKLLKKYTEIDKRNFNCTFAACVSFTFGLEDGIWGLIIFIPDHCLYFYFTKCQAKDKYICIKSFVNVTL